MVAGDDATGRLVRCAHAVAVDLSKSWSLAAFHHTPLINLAARPLPAWMHAHEGLDGITAQGLLAGMPVADQRALQRWFTWHLAGRIVAPDGVTLSRLMRAAMDHPSDADLAINLRGLLACDGARRQEDAA
jgi:hypothetical protein